MASLRTALDALATENSQLRDKVGLAPEERVGAPKGRQDEAAPPIVQGFVEGYGTLRGWLFGREEESITALPPLPPMPPPPGDDFTAVGAPASVAGSGTSSASWEKPGASSVSS